ncbi:UNVERIFIED_CONTAM: hypothetical protein Sindi_2011200 [Sesamum indicum]
MEIYVDDMLVKSRRSQDHLEDLAQAFSTMRSYGMKLNPDKCTFGVGGGKFLGYMVSERGIEANPEKIQAIMNLRSPTTIKEVHKLTEKIASLSRMEVQVVSEAGSWKDEIIKYMENNILPTDPVAAKRVKFRATRFTMLSGQLYKRTLDGPLLKCLDEERALYVMREIHEGSCGNHSGARSLA